MSQAVHVVPPTNNVGSRKDMPTLTPSYLPPPAISSFPSPLCASSNGTHFNATTPTSPKQDAVTQRPDMPSARKRALKVPFVKLDTPTIQEDMAASLAAALLGHVLFLKSQVPFPVAQLGRVPGSSSSAPRATKKRSDMINAFDELSSHLHTTFSALSTALARNPARRSTDTVYLALVLGPTIGAPKARVILVLEGLEVKIWGEREDIDEEEALLSSEGGGDDDDYSSDDGSEAEDDSTREDRDAKEEDTDSTSSEDADAEEPPSSPPASEPPSSRSPSPESEESLRPSSPVPVPAPESLIRRPLRPSLSPKSSQSGSPASRPYLAPRPERTHAEGQQALRAAERLLARTLVNAYAEGGGMAAELAPTQIHVLLRAPRRFSHPAWRPRQNVCTSLDNMLREFLVDSGLGDADDGKPRRRHGVAGVKTEGVLVGCQTGLDDNISHLTNPMTETNEEDELIWWAWDGKLIGFAEW